MKKVLVWLGHKINEFNNDEWDSFRNEGRLPMNMGFGLSLLGYDVNIASPEWTIKKSKKTWNNIELSVVPLYDYYDIVLTYGALPIITNFKFKKAIFIVHENREILGVKDYIKNTQNKNDVICTTIFDNSIMINYIKKLIGNNNVFHFPSLYPIPSVNIGFIPCSYNPRIPELKIFLHYASWKQNTTISGDRFTAKEQLIINHLKNKGYILKLTVLVQNEEMVSSCNIKDDNIKFVYSEKCSYRDIINLIQSSDICITYGSPVFPGNSLTDIISLGKPLIYIGDGRIEIEWKENFVNPIYTNKSIRDNYIIYMQERDKDSIKKLDIIMNNPCDVSKKYSDIYEKNNFNNWKVIANNILSEELPLPKIVKNRVAVFVINPVRSPILDDQYDSFRTEGRIAINFGFGLSLLGFEVNIIFGEWSIVRKKEVWTNVYLSNLPMYRHYNYVVAWDTTMLDRISFDKLVFMDWDMNHFNNVCKFKNETGFSDIHYTCITKHISEDAKSKYELDVNYLPGLYPIPSIHVGFVPYKFNPINSELRIYIYCNLDKIGTKFMHKHQLIIDFLKDKGYKTNLYIHTKSNEMLKNYQLNGDKIKYIYDKDSRYIDIINNINASDICVIVTIGSAGPTVLDAISLGKPIIIIFDKELAFKNTNNLYDNIEYLIHFQENDEESKSKLENFIKNPKESYDKFKESYKEFDFDIWKTYAEKIFIYDNKNNGDILMNDTTTSNTATNTNTKNVNKFGDGISWENHVHEIIKGDSKIFYSKDDETEKINIMKKYKPNGKVLDCGCHIGRWIEIFRGNDYDYTGVDQSYEAIETAKRYKPDGKFVHSLLWNIFFHNEFDIVHTNAVLQHNTLKEQEKILPKMYEALKSDGILVITESTLNRDTNTQRTYANWIKFVESHGFKFMESWHKNEFNLEDNYLFIKTEKSLSKDKNITKDNLIQLLRHNSGQEKHENHSNNLNKPEIVIPKFPPINIITNMNNDVNKNTIYMNEYWNLNDDTIPFVECLMLWRNLKVRDKCHFVYTSKISPYKMEKVKNVFKKAGFDYSSQIEWESETKIEFEKFSISKIRNWEQLRLIHQLINNK